ncbi:ATP-dependent DNA helicase RecG [Patescibacteria group bacterium]|nr:ATP-dependent DNA helicase RecG [Patescibacteria group bacterium]
MVTLETKIEDLNRVGETTAQRLSKLNIKTAQDLLFHFPFRYDDFSKVSDIKNLIPNTQATIRGKIELINSRRSPQKRRFLTECVVSDKTGTIKVIWFNQPYLTKVLNVGELVYLSGKVGFDKYEQQMINPVYEKANKKETIHTARLVPIYPTTQNLSQKQIRFLISSVINLAEALSEWLPDQVVEKYHLLSLGQAISKIHFPTTYNDAQKALDRLKFDELLLFIIQVLLSRQDIEHSTAESIEFNKNITKEFVSSLPFELTNDQKMTSWEILRDLEKETPMNRLLEGEVGSGKTVVAAMAISNALASGKQVAFMAPTEILTQQHFETLNWLLEKQNIEIALLTRTTIKTTNRAKLSKSKLIELIKNNEIKLIVGTHSLIQADVKFNNLGLVIVDEQHRFGVEQRKSIKEKSGNKNTSPHFLSMTATPIPRTLALSLYGDLQLSIIKEMPKERKKVITEVVTPNKREESYKFIKEKVNEGRQAFVVCPLIDPSDKLGVKAVAEEFEILKEEIFPNLSVGLLHGKLKTDQKKEIMNDFLANKINILVTTTVVEVGVNIPNAAIMMIEGAERFGLAQLHQLRGRVGRSTHQSYCLLFSDSNTQKTIDRLQALVESSDGFELAEKDLEFRGPGQLYGKEQSGYIQSLKLASLFDYEIIKVARKQAQEFLEQSPDLKKFPKILERIIEQKQETHPE